MSAERPDEFSNLTATRSRPNTDGARESQTAANRGPADDDKRQETTVVVRGETVPEQQETKSPPKESAPKEATVLLRGETVRDPPSKPQTKDGQPKDDQSKDTPSKDSKPKERSPPKEVSEAKVKLQSRLPALDDDSEVGVQKEHLVTRDGKADLSFTGTLIASAAPPSATKGKWQEYRIYETNGGKHVFSKISRSIYAEEQDTHEAEIFDPAPSSMPSQLLRSARDLTRAHPMTWSDAAVAFFGYDALAKTLYRKLGDQFDEHIS